MRKLALVTGGHSQIAIDVSIELSLNFDVIHISRNPDKNLSENFTSHPNIEIFHLDLLDESAIEQTIFQIVKESNREIETIVFAHRSRENNLSAAIKLELERPLLLIDEVMKHQSARQLRSVIFFSSPASEKILADQELAYHLSKTCISQAVRYLSIKFARLGIRVNGVSPGSFVKKKRSEDFYLTHTEYLKQVLEFIPEHELVSTKNIGSLVAFLASQVSAGINGQIIRIDGGYSNMEESSYFIQANRP
jgi:NAD(P)-dependent dehydrogenase (short-subunit alcohol dehydrogenase family)